MLIDSRPEIIRISSEGDAQEFQEAVHAVEQRLWAVSCRMRWRCAFEDDHTVR